MNKNMRGRSRIKYIAFSALAISVAAAPSHAQDADDRFEFRIEGGNLEQVLNEVRELTDAEFLFSFDLVSVDGLKPVNGQYTIDEALKITLQDTGLSGGLRESGMIVITLNDSAQAQNREGLMTSGKTKKALLASVSALMFSVGGGVGYAQETEEGARFKGRDVVVVTARKRDETALEVPVAISAFGPADIEERGITNAEELSQFVPGFEYEPTGGFGGRGNALVRFRGVNVQNAGATSNAGAVFWDGGYVSNGIGILPLFDLERVEVIKGPQSAYFGRNTFSGAVNYISAKPTEEWGGSLSAAYLGTDEDKGFNVRGFISGPLTDKLGVRVAVSHENRPGDWTFQDGSILGEETTTAIKGSLVYDVTDSVQLTYSGFYVDSEDTSVFASINAAVEPGDCNRTYSGELRDVVTGASAGSFTTDLSASSQRLFCGSIPDWTEDNIVAPFYGGPPPAGVTGGGLFFGTLRGDLATAQVIPPEFDGFIDAPDGVGNTYMTWRNHIGISAELPSGHTIDAFGAFGKFQNWFIGDANYGASGIGDIHYINFLSESEDLVLEARVASPDDQRLRYMLGVNYYNQDSLLSTHLFLAPLSINDTTSEVFSVFGALDYDITDSLTLSAEGRWQDDTFKLNYEGPSGGTGMPTNEEQSYSKFMPRVILSYQPEGANLNIYGSWSKNYLQGFTTNAAAYSAAVPGSGADTLGFFTPVQEMVSYEIGVKHQLNDVFGYAIAAYHMDWENQVNFFLAGFPAFQALYSPGDSEYTGVEAEFVANLTDWIQLSGGYNFVDAEFTDFLQTGSITGVLAPGSITTTTTIDANGNTPRFIAEHSGNFAVDFTLDQFLGRQSFLRLDGIYQGDFFIDNLEYNQIDGNLKLNLRAGAAVNDIFRAEVYALNITNNTSFTPSGATTIVGSFPNFNRRAFGQPPRGFEWGVRLTADF